MKSMIIHTWHRNDSDQNILQIRMATKTFQCRITGSFLVRICKQGAFTAVGYSVVVPVVVGCVVKMKLVGHFSL